MIRNPPASAGDMGLIPESGRSLGRGHGNPLPVFLPGESHRQRSLAGYSPWGHKESGMIEQLTTLSHEEILLLNPTHT